MNELVIRGVPVTFPFEPYQVQRDYMDKVIECLQNGHNGVLESPTGTGKTLCLLCSSLAWLLVYKAHLQISAQPGYVDNAASSSSGSFMNTLQSSLKNVSGKNKSDNKEAANLWGLPKIMYASRTHSQLSQAMQELKRSSYRHAKAAVLGSRDQMCIHPEVSKEKDNATKVHMCQARVKTRTCHFFNNVESKKDDPLVRDSGILDIEDLVTVGKKIKCCPYYLSKELKQSADIVFLPYNYLLDPKSRKANGIELANAAIILDEAHNIERMCEESASFQLTSTDIALCIDEITTIMKAVSATSEENSVDFESSQATDFSNDDLCVLKKIFLAIEAALDEIPLKTNQGSTFDGGFIFELLSKGDINDSNSQAVTALIENLVQYLSTAAGSSPFQKRGNALQKFSDLLHTVFANINQTYKQRISKSYKVHIQTEEKKSKRSDSWLSGPKTKPIERVLSYWCFSPGFGMKQLLEQNIRCVILTSGTLAPLKPLISELGIPINVQLENPHIVNENQIFVKVINQGPDNETLNSNYENRNNPKYISSLGRTILSCCRVVPDGLLVFFPSYPILAKCQQEWQLQGIWSSITDIKPIFIEPQRKDTFITTMSDFYSKINDPNSRGACFMAVCRGKVSEGLDFADMNGRAVIITGLPFPPMMDPRIILKKKYLEEQRTKENEYLSGDEWYSLEASRAVNQAIGRVIRHKNDYGAILLCDVRFNNPRLKTQLSSWLKKHLSSSNNKFGETISQLCRFFKNAEKTLPSPKLKPLLSSEFKDPINYKIETTPVINVRTVPKKFDDAESIPKSNELLCNMNFYKTHNGAFKSTTNPTKPADLFNALDNSFEAALNSCQSTSTETFKRSRESQTKISPQNKKQKFKNVPLVFDSYQKVSSPSVQTPPVNLVDFVKCIKSCLDTNSYKEFHSSVSTYKTSGKYDDFVNALDRIFFPLKNTHYLLKDMGRFLKEDHKKLFLTYCEKL